jgi:hypothetical protein
MVGERVIIPPETWMIVAVTFKRLVCRFSYALFPSLENVEMGRWKLASKNFFVWQSWRDGVFRERLSSRF